MLDVLQPLWSGEHVDYDGEFYQLHDVSMKPTPAQRVPLIGAGHSTPALGRAASRCDGWLFTSALMTSHGRSARPPHRVSAAFLRAASALHVRLQPRWPGGVGVSFRRGRLTVSGSRGRSPVGRSVRPGGGAVVRTAPPHDRVREIPAASGTSRRGW
ncbi:LLM class flavin-dependent oxidoreductase [Streptomyces sp. NPDC056716]|uniref:LLM class flavin-dependent oxidoreductase n=1 Tax=unclassified Streptomyces TaxID=2593676 RepID=UPI0036AE8D9D